MKMIKKLIFIFLSLGIIEKVNAQSFAFQSIIAPSQICQVDSFDVNITINFAHNAIVIDSVKSTIAPGLIKINLIMKDNVWGQMKPFQIIETIRLPIPSSGFYTILAQTILHNQVSSSINTSTNVCNAGTTAIPDESTTLKANIYPNPTTDFINIDISDKTSVQIELANLTGRIVKTESVSESNSRIDISGLPKGIYILKIQTGKSSYTSKVVKE